MEMKNSIKLILQKFNKSLETDSLDRFGRWLQSNEQRIQSIEKMARDEIFAQYAFLMYVYEETEKQYEKEEKLYEEIVELLKENVAKTQETSKLERAILAAKHREFAPFMLSVTMGCDFDPASPFYLNHLRKLKMTKQAQEHALQRGRSKSNQGKKNKKIENDDLINKAVSDYLVKASKDGLDTSNAGILKFLETKTNFKSLSKNRAGKPYTELGFKRKVEMAAANWRKQNKMS